MGNGRRWMNSGSILDTIAGGWDLSGFFRMRSGETVNIISGRGTINRGGSRGLTNTVHLEGIDIKALQTKTGAFRHSDGRVTLFDSSLIAEGGAGNPSVFKNPGLLEAGTLGLSPVSGPWYTSLDVGLRKSIAPAHHRRVAVAAPGGRLQRSQSHQLRRVEYGRPFWSGCRQPPKPQQHPVRTDQLGLLGPHPPGGSEGGILARPCLRPTSQGKKISTKGIHKETRRDKKNIHDGARRTTKGHEEPRRGTKKI